MQGAERQEVHQPPAPAGAAESLALVEAMDPVARAACARGRALLDVVAGLTDDADVLRGAALLPLLKAGAIDDSRAAEVFGIDAARIAAELLRIDALGRSAWRPAALPSALQAEALRKMLLAVFSDPRLLLVRLVAQLARLRECEAAPAEERERIGLETREIYAPLASRLGVWQLKWELEDLAFRYLEPEHYERVASWLAAKHADRERYIADVVAVLEAELDRAPIRARVAGRSKHLYSIWRKMQRKGRALEQLYDLRAVRVLVETIADCYAALGIVHGLWPYIPGEFDDYIATPKRNMYRSLHTVVVGPEQLPVEIQIRTHEMHAHAELGVAAHWRYKEGGRTDPAYEQKIVWLRQLLEPAELGESGRDFLERVRTELFEDHVYVLSPRGEVIELPRGATPLDYAYRIHSGLGHRCRGAKVNGRMVPLDQPLINGDRVEILAGKHAGPSRDWLVPSLGYLASPRHRAKVRAWFRKLDEAKNRAQGRQLLERELQRLGARSAALPEITAALGYKSAEQLHQAIGEGEVSAAQIAGAAQRGLPSKAPAAPGSSPAAPRPSVQVPEDTVGLQIEGVGNLLSKFARCCLPVPPEPIAGYITVGRGVTVHRRDCANLRRLEQRNPERIMAVDWGGRRDRGFSVDVGVRASTWRGLVRDLSAAVADSKVSVRAMNAVAHEKDGTADVELKIVVHDLEDLSRVLARVRGLPNVLSAERRA